MASGENEGKTKIIGIGTVIVALVVAVWFWYWHATSQNITGEFGDRFGPLTALFSGLAFVGVIITVLLQSQELKLQRKELRETRDVMKEQTKNIERQILDDNFYQQVRLHNENIGAIRQSPPNEPELTGRRAIEQIVYNIQVRTNQRITQTAKRQKIQPLAMPVDEQFELFILVFEQLAWSTLSHIIQSFAAIAELVHEGDDSQRQKYSKFLWAQCSITERRLYHYFRITPFASNNINKVFDDLRFTFDGEWNLPFGLNEAAQEAFNRSIHAADQSRT